MLETPYHTKALPEGTTLREWRLEQVLGVGGFGIVYRGRGTYFDELVAIKEYFPSAISDRVDGETVTPTDSSSVDIYALGLQKFVEEAKVLWALSQPERHPNIVSVRSLFEINGTAYMVMDFESGVSLSQMLHDGRRFDEASLMALVRPIAEGLDRAHRAGVVHRDIKPANILVAEGGRPVLIDFGSARFDAGQATSTKVTFYTPPYAAVEQYVKTFPQGAWTDIYALGVVLYQCVTGEKPPEVLERLHGGLGEALSAREWPGFSRAFTQAVDAAMTIRPSDRPQSISAWLKLFDAPAAPPPAPAVADDDDRTRIGAPIAAPAAMFASAPTPSVAAATLPPEPAPAKAPSRAGGLWFAVAAAVVLLGVGAWLVLKPAGTHTQPAAPASASPAAPSAMVTPRPVAAATASAPNAGAQVDLNAVKQAGQAAEALASDAQHLGRPASETAALSAAAARIDALAQQISAAAANPAQAAQAPALVAQLNAAAGKASLAEVGALVRVAQGQTREAGQALGGSAQGAAAQALGDLRSRSTGLSAASGRVRRAGDGAAALQAADAALTSFGAVETAYDTAQLQYAPAKRAALAAIVAQAQAMTSRIQSEAAAAPKPWLFAGQARKQAYQALQADATNAKVQQIALNGLSSMASSTTDLARLDDALARGAALKQTIYGLYAQAATSYGALAANPAN